MSVHALVHRFGEFVVVFFFFNCDIITTLVNICDKI